MISEVVNHEKNQCPIQRVLVSVFEANIPLIEVVSLPLSGRHAYD